MFSQFQCLGLNQQRRDKFSLSENLVLFGKFSVNDTKFGAGNRAFWRHFGAKLKF